MGYTRMLKGSSTSYPRNLNGFIGTDAASETSRVSSERMAYCANMWRDYESENGGAIETLPGWRKLISCFTGHGSGDSPLNARIYGIFAFRGESGAEHLVIHAGKLLYRIPFSELESLKYSEYEAQLGNKLYWSYRVCSDMNEARSVAFENRGKLYILDGENYLRLDGRETAGDEPLVTSLYGQTYVPVTYLNGERYEQRNMLSRSAIERYTAQHSQKADLWESYYGYELKTTEQGDKYLELTGINAEAKKLTYAYIPGSAYYEGERYTIRAYKAGFFDGFTETVQLVCEAPLYIGEYVLSGMIKLERLVLRSPEARFAFNACDRITFSEPGNINGVETTVPLSEVWIANPNTAFNNESHEYGSASDDGITSKAERVMLYMPETKNEIWVDVNTGESFKPKKTSAFFVEFREYTLGDMELHDVGEEFEISEPGAAELEYLRKEGKYRLSFPTNIAYSHLKMNLNGETVSVLLRDPDSGTTCEEAFVKDGKARKVHKLVLYEPASSIECVTASDGAERDFMLDETDGSVYTWLYVSDLGTDISVQEYVGYNDFSTFENLADVYQNGLSSDIPAYKAIHKCTVVCEYDGRVFFTGNPDLPNTVFFSGRDRQGVSRPDYVGIYNYFNDGIGSIPNVAMVSNASMLTVLKGDIPGGGGGTAYYHVGEYNSDPDTKDILPRIYPSTEGMSNIPCIGAACNFADDIVYLSSRGLEGISKQSLNLERTVGHRSSRIDPLLRQGISKETSVAEWKGYLCILNPDGRMYMADSRAMSHNSSSGNTEYEWFTADGIGSYTGDEIKYAYRYGGIKATRPYYEEVEVLDVYSTEISVSIGEYSYDLKIGEGEVAEGDVYSVSNAWTGRGEDSKQYNFITPLEVVKCDRYLCPVEKTDERVNGTFSPATVLFSYRDRLFFGTASGDVCVFNTDKRGMCYQRALETETGEKPRILTEPVGADEIHSAWYDRCGHRYESGFATLSDNCGYPQFSKSTVGKTLTVKAKRMKNSAFKLSARSDREDWREIESFTASHGTFEQADFENLSFEDLPRGIYSSREKLKRWCEKQLYFYSDGFRRPFGIYGISYCYTFAGRVR